VPVIPASQQSLSASKIITIIFYFRSSHIIVSVVDFIILIVPYFWYVPVALFAMHGH